MGYLISENKQKEWARKLIKKANTRRIMQGAWSSFEMTRQINFGRRHFSVPQVVVIKVLRELWLKRVVKRTDIHGETLWYYADSDKTIRWEKVEQNPRKPGLFSPL